MSGTGAASVKLVVVNRGRSRKPGPREENGRPRRNRGDVRAPNWYNRGREYVTKGPLRVAYGEVGRWEQSYGLIDAVEARVATDFAVHVGEYEAMMGFPKRSARSPAFELGHRGYSPPVVAGGNDGRIKRVKQKHSELLAVVPSGEWRDALYCWAVEDRHIPTTKAHGMKQVLAALKAVFDGRTKGIRAWRA